MGTISFTFTFDEMPSLPPVWRNEIERLLQGTSTETAKAVAAPIREVEDVVVEKGADLSVAQATAFLEGCSDKTKKVIRAIVASGTGKFRLNALAQTLNVGLGDLGGVWGGLTKRTRTILGDKKANLIAWRNFYDLEDNKWLDAAGTLSEVTYASFRQALGVQPNAQQASGGE